jgi:hypothetical protein
LSGLEEHRLFGRKRRANTPGGREKSYRVYVTAEEDARLVERAEAEQVTVPRLLFESAVAARGETSTERKRALAELFRLTRQMAGVASNVNQLARFANAEGRFPAEAEVVVGEYRRLAAKVEDTIDRLAAP